MARGQAVGPSSTPASQGATIQASPAMGSAATAQTARIRSREYWGSWGDSFGKRGSVAAVVG